MFSLAMDFISAAGRRYCGTRATPAAVTGLTRRVRRGHFRCDIKGLGAESVKLIEDFRRTVVGAANSADSTLSRGVNATVHLRRETHMTRRDRSASRVRRVAGAVSVGAALGLALCATGAQATDYPITSQQRGTAQRVAQDGVPLSELAPNAPDSYTVKTRDTLWDISKLFLRSPWRWPELWGMNLEQIRNPHLIYPGQVLYLDKTGGRARLRMGQAVGGGTDKLSPRIRSSELGAGSLPSIPFGLIEPFLNDAVIFQTNELEAAPRIVAAQE